MTKQAYQLDGKLCPNCQSSGPLLLNPSDDFSVNEDGSLKFPDGVWGLDIGCECSCCGFSARMEDFCIWVEVTGERRAQIVASLSKSQDDRSQTQTTDTATTTDSLIPDRVRRCQKVITKYSDENTFTNLVDMLADAMHWCDANGEDFHYALCVAGKHFVAELNDEQTEERRLP